MTGHARRPVQALAGALLAALLADARAQGPPTVQVLVRGQHLDANGAVRVWNLVGSVRVTAWARDSVVVVARVPTGAQLFFGGGARGVKVGVEMRDGSAAPAALEVRVPRGARVWVKTSTAPVAVAGLSADVELYSVSGALRVTGRPATLRVESLDGSVEVGDGAAWVRARTSSGAIAVRGPVDDAELTTVGGGVRLDGRVGERARVESVTGAVHVAGTVAGGAAVEVDTHAGDVWVATTPPAPTLDLLTLRGRIVGPAVRGRVQPRGGGQAALVPGAAGAGGGRVEVRSFRGGITVGGR